MRGDRIDTFTVANISGTITTYPGGTTHVHVDGSGPLTERPWNLNDWLVTNLLALVAAGVHLGYLIAAVRILWRWRHVLRQSSRIIMSGHSLGGATVEVAAVLGIFFGVRHVCALSYGGPRPWWIPTWPMWWIVSRIAGADIEWYVAGADPVPRIPPWNAHIGRRVTVVSTSDRLTPIGDHIEGYREAM